MAAEKWDETGRVWEEDHGLLDEEQVAVCRRADVAEPPSPVPTRMISNGEYMPAPQTRQQKQVESRVGELAEAASRKLGISRRQFLAGSGGMAAALLAM
ncbi:MAG TPA: twin-arginine translocation signal domain-containing protein, partial [Pirellulaceae bacterium]|nr:twin-arginine translocation signal domain-containing protein [Pirellulaceae bacterium]